MTEPSASANLEVPDRKEGPMTLEFEAVMHDLGIRPSIVIHAMETGMHRFEENAKALRDEGSGTMVALAEQFESYASETREALVALRA